jgi:glucosyl-dolichyl phosphate glucuronosyltransferase
LSDEIDVFATMFTLALCTYNRAQLLSNALESLAACRPPVSDWELLLVDNNSADKTRPVAESFVGRLPLRYVFEPRQGLAIARNRALSECRGETLLFTDDDLQFDSDWLVTYERAFAEQTAAGWFGGRVRPLWPRGAPRWLRDESMALIAGLMVRYDLGSENRPYENADPHPFGASFALRRTVFEQTGLFRSDLGVCGDVPGRGEEADYLIRVRHAGVPGLYVGTSSAWHWQDERRFEWSYLYRFGIQKGVAELRMQQPGEIASGSPIREMAYAVKAVLQLLKGRGDRARQCIINMGIEHGLRVNGAAPGGRSIDAR